jgi:hypothetical protein
MKKIKEVIHEINWARVILLFLIFSIYSLSIYIQYTTNINVDASNALHESSLMLSGGKYFYDFFETTPPMYFYIFFPVAYAIKNFPTIYFVFLYVFYILTIVTASLILCAFFIKKILIKNDCALKYSLILFISAVFVLQPPFCFGQREYFALILTAPYFLLLAMRISEKKCSDLITLFTAIIAGMGFCIKPHFCLAFILAELYFYFRKRKQVRFFRIENLAILIIFFLYLASTYWLYPAYFNVIIPLALKFYYQGIPTTLKSVFLQIYFVYSIISLLFYFLSKEKNDVNLISSVFAIAVIGNLLSYISQIVPWEYHTFTAFGFTVILNFLSLYQFSVKKNIENKKIVLYAILAFLIFKYNAFYIMQFENITETYRTAFTILLILFLASLYLNHVLKIKILHFLSVFILALSILAFPAISSIQIYKTAKISKEINLPLVKFINKYAYNKSIYFLATILNYEYPLADYAGAIHSSRFCYLIWLPGLIREATGNPKSDHITELYKINAYFTHLMADDINKKKPAYIFVDSSKFIKTPVFSVEKFDFIKFFSDNPQFAKVWKNYHYLSTINAEPYYKIDVYKLQK